MPFDTKFQISTGHLPVDVPQAYAQIHYALLFLMELFVVMGVLLQLVLVEFAVARREVVK